MSTIRWRPLLLLPVALLLAACARDPSTVATPPPATPTSTGGGEPSPAATTPATTPTTPTGSATATGDLGLVQEGTILVGSDIAFEPFESFQDGEPVGFDIDLMTEIADRLGVEVSFQNTPFSSIFTQLAGGAFDAVISAVTITEERDQTVDFTDPYYAANQGLAVTEDSDIAGVADLAGRVVGVQAGTTGLDYAEANFTEAMVQSFPTAVAAFDSLQAGQIDAVFIDLPVVGEQVEQGGVVLAEEVSTDELYGIAVQEGNDALRTALNRQLDAIIADGTYADIYGRWFEGEPPTEFQR